MRQRSIIFVSVVLACTGSVLASVHGRLSHGEGIAGTASSLHTGPASWFFFPPSEPVRLILMGLSLIGISLLVRRWASR